MYFAFVEKKCLYYIRCFLHKEQFMLNKRYSVHRRVESRFYEKSYRKIER